MALITHGISLFQAQIIDPFHKVNLLIGIVVCQLIVIGIIQRLRKGVADVELIVNRADG